MQEILVCILLFRTFLFDQLSVNFLCFAEFLFHLTDLTF